MTRTFRFYPHVVDLMRRTGVTLEQQVAFEKAIMAGRGIIVQGTGGLQKLRCGAAGRGKSSGLRLLIADYPESGRCYVIAAFAKNDRGNMSRAELDVLASVKAALDSQMEGIGPYE